MSLPSFPQRGQPNLAIFELPDSAPKILKDWIGQIQFTKQMATWFSLIGSSMDETNQRFDDQIAQLFGQSGRDADDVVAHLTTLLSESWSGDRDDSQLVMARMPDGPGAIERYLMTSAQLPDDPTSVLQRVWDFRIISDTAAHRAGYPAAQFDGMMFVDSDTGERWISVGGAWTDGDLLVSGYYKWLAGTAFNGRLTHVNSANRDYLFPDESVSVVNTTTALTSSRIALGQGLAKVKVLGSLGTTTTVLHGNAGGDPSFGAVSLTADVSGILPVANGGTGVGYNRISDTVAATNLGADFPAAAFANSSTAGTYRCSYYLEDTTADVAAGGVTMTVAFTDDAGATTVVSAAVPLTGIGILRTSGVFFIQNAGGNITIAVGHTGVFGTSKYALYACLERLS